MNNLFINFGKTLIFSIIITLMALISVSLVLSFFDVLEEIISPSIIVISSISILNGSFLISRKIKEKGILNGAILGALYIVTIYIISSVLNKNFSLNLYSGIMIGMGILAGAVGGILGVNLKSKV